MLYFIAETDASATMNNPALWRPCGAKTLAGAKAAASASRAFQGTAAWVGVRNEAGEFRTVAVRYPKKSFAPGWRNI